MNKIIINLSGRIWASSFRLRQGFGGQALVDLPAIACGFRRWQAGQASYNRQRGRDTNGHKGT